METTSLTLPDQISRIDQASMEEVSRGAVIFKHSNRCYISNHVWRTFQRDWGFSEEDVKLFYIDVVTSRELSQLIASHYHVQHESPQVLLIKNGRCVGNASHEGVSVKLIQEWLNA